MVINALLSTIVVGDRLARISPNGGYCSPVNSFLVVAVERLAHGDTLVTTQHPETGELDTVKADQRSTTTKVVGLQLGTA
jgi:hypothetical protein